MRPPVMDSVNIFTAVLMVYRARHRARRHLGQQLQCEDTWKIFAAEWTLSVSLGEERHLIGMYK